LGLDFRFKLLFLFEMNAKADIFQLLNKYWGYKEFRPKQEEIIRAVLNVEDTLALLPTGGGKSICFQIPALVKEGICLVISPLIALMQDQVDNLNKKGIKSLAIHSGMSKREIDISLDNAAYGDYKFLYLSPERLGTPMFQERLHKMKVNLIAVDEAHCISQWGYDFRPSYLKIASIRDKLKGIPILALTATATPNVVSDIQDKLEFKTESVIRKSFYRPNLIYVVRRDDNPLEKLLKIIRKVNGSAIVYVSSRSKCKQVSIFLNQQNIQSDFYHAGLGYEERMQKQAKWIKGNCRVIVATNAFGMGIDKADVRLVVHLDAPETLEAYFQEAGRAGRDGKKAYAVLISNSSVSNNLEKRVLQKYPEIELIKSIYLAICNYLQIPYGSAKDNLYHFDLNEFAERYKFQKTQCLHAIRFLEKEELLQFNFSGNSISKVHIIASPNELYAHQIKQINHEDVIKALLRLYGGIMEDYVKISEHEIARLISKNKNSVSKVLQRLDELNFINYIEKTEVSSILFLKDRLEQKSLRFSKSNYADRKQIGLSKMKSVLMYLNDNDKCRSQSLLAYFGEKKSNRCGRCDVCIQDKKVSLKNEEFENIKNKIKQELKTNQLTLSQLMKLFPENKIENFKEVMAFLVDNSQVKLSKGLYSWEANKSIVF